MAGQLSKPDQKILNPFPGLRPFSINESHLFFGRRKQVDEITRELQQNRFIAVIGASGSGKSSLVYCGVIPELMRSVSSSQWHVITTRPGNTPLTSLIRDAASVMGKEITARPQDLFNTTDGIPDLFRDNDGRNLLIMIDQFEEIFRFSKITSGEDASEDAAKYVKFIVSVLAQKEIPVWLVVTMRSDFIGECSQYQDFTRLINHSNYLVPRMTISDFRDCIEEPVKVAGASIRPELVKRLLDDLGDNPDQLPVLQHVLMRTWDYWQKHNDRSRPVSVADYEAVGTISKALSEHANEAYDELNEKGKQICEKIFRTLTEKGGDNRGTRRPTPLKQLAGIAQAGTADVITVLETFRSPGRSFLVPSFTVPLNEESVIDISHESFMRIWERLRSWVDEEAAAVTMYKRLAQSAADYQDGKTGLWRPPDLHLATNWKAKTKPTLAWAVRHDPAFERTMVFLDTSEKEFRMEEENKIRLQKRTLRRAKVVALVLGSAAVISLGLFLYARQLSIIARNSENRANQQAELARTNEARANEQAELAKKNEAEAVKQSELAKENERKAIEQQNIALKNYQEAEMQKLRANDSAMAAQKQRDLARNNELKAIENERLARIAEKEAYQRRMLSIAKSMAVKSIQVPASNPELKALLAYQAYLFNEKYQGISHDVDIYGGLYKSLKAIAGQTYNVYKGHSFTVRSVAFVPGTSKFYSSGADGKILLWDAGDQKKNFNVLYTDAMESTIEHIKISNNGQYLAATVKGKGLLLFNLKNPSAQPLVPAATETDINSLVFDPSGKRLYFSGNKNLLEMYDLVSSTCRTLATETSMIISLCVSPDGSTISGGTMDGRLLTWNPESSSPATLVFNNQGTAINSVTYSGDGSLIACGDINGNVTLLRTVKFDRLNVLSGHNARINDIQFSPGNNTMATASNDGTVLFWDLTDLTNPPIIMDDHQQFVFSVAFSPDGNYLVSSSLEEDRLIIRPTRTRLMAEKMCSYLTRNFTKEEWNTYVGEDIPFENTCNILKLANDVKPDETK